MKRLLNWLIVLAGCVGAFYGVGLIVPRNQTLGSKTNFTSKPDAAYEVVASVETWPQWHPDVAAVEERPKRNDHPIWSVRTKDGESYDLEVTTVEEVRTWQAVYTRGGTRTMLRFDFNWFGSGARVRVNRTADTRDPWLRARGFFLPRDEAEPIAILNGLAEHLGETPSAESN